MKRIFAIIGILCVAVLSFFLGRLSQKNDNHSLKAYQEYYNVSEELLDSINSINPQIYDSIWLQAEQNDTLMGRYDACVEKIRNNN